MSRRSFIRQGALAAAALSVGPTRSSSAETGDQLKLGGVGCGWWRMVDVETAFKAGGVDILALCDADREHLEKSAGQGRVPPGPAAQDVHYQDLLGVDGLQAVIIATPPPWHALQFIAAPERGLDMYREKPPACDIREGEAMVAAARKAGASCPDWYLWCGPASKQPYSPNVGHFAWLLDKEYGHGHLVDWGIHLIDTARWILGEIAPKSVQAAGGLHCFKDKITTPDGLTAHFEFETG